MIFTALGGVLAGFALAGALLYRHLGHLDAARRQIATEQRRAANAERLARRDDTTGLPNRRAFLEHLEQALAADTPVGVVMLDLDDFKTVNDTFSHETGNDLLTAVGMRLADLRTPVQLAARLSGDEFALLVTGDAEQTRACARAAWRAITSTPIPIGDRTDWRIKASVGYTTDGATPRDLLRHADAAMYQAKQAGGGVCDRTAATDAWPKPPGHGRCRDAHRR
ncbi:diguanylate cyclase [Actinoplanes sp. NEAU-A11]|uniref:Diguanylate cyclase n=2 Tax=Actinoplanes aureus TaxID=2792083 RepID=A0A931G1S1_9ACTN|nr:diguanylate cyclase [Actinoplanes aureus]